ncbi:MAG: hypothetical protein LQ339_004565 [Xanthoria mediterranea]|nr:MAG: hypothetical protein LQ339_004565 [Xanthoria mediterranea]
MLTILPVTVFAALTPGPPFVRLDKNDAMVIVADLQVGLYQVVHDFDPITYRNNILAHTAIASLFSLPIVLTTSAETGPNGPLPKEIAQMYPTAPLIRRNGEVDAWDNSDFRAAVRAANKSQIILAGITTDVCTEFLALSLRAEGYTVFANTEGSGTFTQKLADDANERMRGAGVVLQGVFAIVMDLMRDWRGSPGSKEVLPWLDTYLPAYGYVARAHGAAVLNGTLAPGEEGL